MSHPRRRATKRFTHVVLYKKLTRAKRKAARS